jgi:phage gp36-like protein
VTNHISRADTIINSHIVERYDISGFDTAGSVPPVLKTYSEDIASYYVLRSLYGGDGQNLNEYIQEYYKAMEDLVKIKEGEMSLFDSSGSQIPSKLSSTVDMISSNTESYTPTFGEDDPLSWATDNDKLTTLQDDRD